MVPWYFYALLRFDLTSTFTLNKFRLFFVLDLRQKIFRKKKRETPELFKLFNFDDRFLQSDPLTRDCLDSYKYALNVVTELRVVNDTAEQISEVN